MSGRTTSKFNPRKIVDRGRSYGFDGNQALKGSYVVKSSETASDTRNDTNFDRPHSTPQPKQMKAAPEDNETPDHCADELITYANNRRDISPTAVSSRMRDLHVLVESSEGYQQNRPCSSKLRMSQSHVVSDDNPSTDTTSTQRKSTKRCECCKEHKHRPQACVARSAPQSQQTDSPYSPSAVIDYAKEMAKSVRGRRLTVLGDPAKPHGSPLTDPSVEAGMSEISLESDNTSDNDDWEFVSRDIGPVPNDLNKSGGTTFCWRE